MTDLDLEVSVLCVTYNQSKYLRRALNSMVSQCTNFKYEIIIHDDASTDDTHCIIDEYKSLYPDIICPIIESENQYSKGVSFIGPIIKKHARGKYIAICEDDDYWIDNNKLQIQRDVLDLHPECDMCACWGCTVSENGNSEISQIRPRKNDGILSVEDVILGGGQYLVSSGLFFRKEIYDDMLGLSSLDYSQQMRGALKGGIYYIDRKMAAYRRYSKGSWTNEVLKNSSRLGIQWEKEKQQLAIFDKQTQGRFHSVIMKRMMAYTPFESQLEKYKQEIIEQINECARPVYIWGMGRRGRSLASFFYENKITIDGVCDAVNESVGGIDEYGNSIVHTEYVLNNAKTIIASTRWAYDDLITYGLNMPVYDFQKYMPYG